MLLELDAVTRSFGGVRAVDGAGFAVAAGQVHGLIGPNGAGKTTVINLISGLLRPERGRIVLGGRRIDGLPPHRVAALGVRRTYQTARLFGAMTATENVIVGRHANRKTSFVEQLWFSPRSVAEDRALSEQANALLDRVGLVSRRDKRMEQNLELGGWQRRDRAALARDVATMLDRFPILARRLRAPTGSLSGGEQQMLAIARALVARPRLLLLDEPSLGLAPQLVKQIIAILREIHAEGRTILLVEQNARTSLAISDYAYVLESGQVVLEGTGPTLAQDSRVIDAYLGAAVVAQQPNSAEA